MNLKKIKLIASDLDGTLLKHSSLSCNPRVYPLIEEIIRRGIYFVPASGRTYPSLKKLFQPVNSQLTYLCENGSLVMHLDQVVVKRAFEDDLAMELAHAILEQKDTEVLISGERTSYLIPKSKEFVRHMREDVGNNVSIITSPLQIEEPIIKVSFCTNAKNLRTVEEQLGPRFQGRANMVTSGTEWIDFAPLHTSKGEALKQLGEILSIEPEEMMAFGDNENDRSMLSYVGNPYLMDPCNPSILDIPGKRTTSVEDVLEEWLKRSE